MYSVLKFRRRDFCGVDFGASCFRRWFCSWFSCVLVDILPVSLILLPSWYSVCVIHCTQLQCLTPACMHMLVFVQVMPLALWCAYCVYIFLNLLRHLPKCKFNCFIVLICVRFVHRATFTHSHTSALHAPQLVPHCLCCVHIAIVI
jgi:hypothetical protein